MHPFRECDSATAVTEPERPWQRSYWRPVWGPACGRPGPRCCTSWAGGRSCAIRWRPSDASSRSVSWWWSGTRPMQVRDGGRRVGPSRHPRRAPGGATRHRARGALRPAGARRLHGRRPHPLWRRPADPSGDAAPAGRGAPRSSARISRCSRCARQIPPATAGSCATPTAACGASSRSATPRPRRRRSPRSIRESTACGAESLRPLLAALRDDNAQREFYLTDIVAPGGAGGSPGDHARERAARTRWPASTRERSWQTWRRR